MTLLDSVNNILIKNTLSFKDRKHLYVKFRQYLRKEKDIFNVLNSMILVYTRRGKKPNDAIAKILTDCIMQMSAGVSLCNSLKEWIPPEELSVIQAYEIQNCPDVGFDKAIDLVNRNTRVKKSIRKCGFILTYTMFSSFAIVALICAFMVPEIVKTIPLEKWNFLQLSVYYYYYIVTNCYVYLVVFLVFIIYIHRRLKSRLTGTLRYYMDKWWPPFVLYRWMVGATFVANVEALLSAGIEIKPALELLKGTSDSNWLNERIDAALFGMASGEKNLGTALDSSGYDFPSEEAIVMMSAIFETSNKENALADFSEEWSESIVETVEVWSAVLEIISMLISAISVVSTVIIMFSLISKIFNF
ncbi:hypothetical protein HLB25_10400 [Dickeya dadantii]|uniref:type II secretion system F family protein n=1 Tax=Dickeya dadantii TaxID=204038 RepID=UPI00149608B5|nr:type II secretion system F family protein [Dickeya dadantii]NPE55920.1 hypothetical protein [Dickeya dadantii]NPE67144.1 hypothetical protein [Dickeya dadantii]